MKLTKFLVAIIATAGFLQAGTYNVDSAHSSVGFKVRHLMISYVKGKFDNFSGSFDYDKEQNSISKLNGEVVSASVNTANEKRDKHLKSKDFFDVEKYPKITFSLEKFQDSKAYGTLNMHGVAKEVVLDYESLGTVKDPWGNQRAGFSLSGEVNREDFGLVYNDVLEAGGVAIGEKVKLEIEIQGVAAK